MKTPHYLGLDVGGTGAKAGVFDAAGKLKAFARRGFHPIAAAPNQAELPVSVIEDAARAAVREAVKSAGAGVKAMSISSQGQTFVSIDKRGNPLHPSIIWYDSRASEQARFMRERLKKRASDPDMPVINDMASAPKILWLREHKPGLMKKAARFLLLPDFISYRLTGRAATDPNTAGSSGLCAFGNTAYYRPALEAAGIRVEQLAEILPSGSPIGFIAAERAKQWGLSPDTLLVTGTNDQYAGALGAGVCRPGILSITTGTCLALVTLTRVKPSGLPPGLFTGKFPLAPFHFILAYSKTAGVALEWFRREFAPGMSLADLDALAARSSPGAGGLTVLPWFDGAVSPVPNPKVRAVFHGLTLSHTKADIFRALMESLAFCARENIGLMRKSGYPIKTIRAIGGGARSLVWLQILADATGMPVEQPAVTESATLGAAMLAARGCGDFPSLRQASASLYRCKRVFKPDPARAAAYARAHDKYRVLAESALRTDV